MSLSLTDLLRLRTRDELRDKLLGELASRGFPVTSWALGGVARTLVEGVAQGTADLWLSLAAIAGGMLLDTSTGDWLTALAKSHYGVTRIEATFATGYVRLTAVSGAGPYNLTPASVLVSDGVRLYRSTNTTTLVVPAGGYVDVPVRAEVAGAGGNVPALTVLVTPALAGVDVSSPVYGGGPTWRAFDAVDREGDEALRTRCRARWATLATAGCGTRAAYAFHITSATIDGTDDGPSAGATRVGFLAPPGTGEVPIRIAGASGLLSNTQRDAVRAWVALRKPINDVPQIEHAGTVSVDLTGSSVRFRPGYNSGPNRALVQSAITDYVNALPMGSEFEPAFLDEAALGAAIYVAVLGGVADVDLTCGDVTITEGTIATVDATVVAFSE